MGQMTMQEGGDMMPGELVTLVAVLAGALAADLSEPSGGEAAAFKEALKTHQATMAPVQYASRDDDGSVYVTVTIADPAGADRLEADLNKLSGVLSVYRKPSASLP